MTDDTESFAALGESTRSKSCMREHFMVTQKTLYFKKVSQGEITWADFNSMRNVKKVLNKRLTSMSNKNRMANIICLEN